MPVDLSIKLPKKQYKKSSSNFNTISNFDSSIDESEKLEIPIVVYPPFKLRSSMYDKDPLIWAGLLLTYIEYMKFVYSIISCTSRNSKTSGTFQILDGELLLSQKLSEGTIIETKKFIRKYLKETSYEMDQILTLGGVNIDIANRNVTLRNLVFCVVQRLGLLYFEINGELIWDFIKVYGEGNCFKIREMILNPFILNDRANNGSSILMNSLQNHLELLIIEGKLNYNSHSDIQLLAILLGLINKFDIKNKQQSHSKKEEFFQRKIEEFTNKFVDLRWIQMLERYYSDGNSIHSDTCKILMMISLISCSIDHLANIVHQLFERFNLANAKQFAREFRLFSAIINDNYVQFKISKSNDTLLTTKLADVLKNCNDISNEEIEQLLTVFPNLTSLQVRKLLKNNKGKPVHVLINEFLEDPEKIDKLINSTDESNGEKKIVMKEKFNPKNVILGKKKQLSFNDIRNNEIYDSDDNKLRKKTLELSLSLIYNNDEDEPDDTYVDAEITQSEALGNTSSNKTNEELKDQFIKQEKLQNIEMYLYTLYTRNPSVADRSAESRRGKLRKEIIQKTGWSNEQIEGWFYMLNKDHNKKSNLESLLILNRGEVKLMNTTTSDGQEKQNKYKGNDDASKKDDSNTKSKQSTQQKRKKQNKSQGGNHNRKREHSKKMAQVI